MTLEKLIKTNIVDFHRKYSGPKTHPHSSKNKTKLVSTDIFDKEIEKLVGLYKNKDDVVILANAGGSDAVLSMYANIYPDAGVTLKSKPHLFIVDRKYSNLENFFYRILLANMNPESKEDYVRDMFGITGDDIILLKGEKEPVFGMPDLEMIIANKKYNPREHFKMLKEKIELRRQEGYSEPVLEFLEEVAKSMTSYLGKNNNYEEFGQYMLETIHSNPKSHYLSNDRLYHAVSGMMNLIPGKEEYNVHMMNEDMTKPNALSKFRDMLNENGIKENGRGDAINIAFVPHLMRNMDQIMPFLRDQAEYVIHCEKDMQLNRRFLIGKLSKDILPSVINVPGLEKYKKQVKSRVKLKSLTKTTGQNGLPRTLLLSNMNIGYAYADEKTLADFVDVSNETGIEEVIIGGAIYGPFFFKENARRLLKDPEYDTLDAQLREFKRVRDGFKANITYIIGDSDKQASDNLFILYLKEKRRRETGVTKITHGVFNRRDEYNSKNDNAKMVIENYLFPYLLRLGKDTTRYYHEDAAGSRIVELVDVFTRLHEGKALREQDLQYVDASAIVNAPKFSVVNEHSKTFKDKKGETGIRVFGNTLFSRVTQYKNPTVVLEEIAKMAQNGVLEKNMPEQVLVDTKQASQMLKVMGDRVILFVPDLVDDRRYFDKDFLPAFKQTLSDPVHKRVTIKKDLNLPGGWVVSGDIRDRMYIEPFFPRVFEMMEEVQRSGQAKRAISVLLMHDQQIGSISERPDMFVKAMDYAFMERKCIGAIGIGDFIQGRNYPGMPIENAILGGVSIGTMQRGMTRMMRPFYTLPQIEFWTAAEGNHEWNSDRFATGVEYLSPLEQALEQHMYDTDHKLITQFPIFSKTFKGDVVRAPFGFIVINGYGVLYSHMFAQRGGGGSSARPTTQLSVWERNVGRIAKDHDILLGAHYHVVEMNSSDNRFNAILGSDAGTTGYEIMRQMASAPVNAIIDFFPDGRFGIELFSERFFKDYNPQHPILKKEGVEGFLTKHVFVEDVYELAKQSQNTQKFYRRTFRDKPVTEIK